jgi:hypothetical protein
VNDAAALIAELHALRARVARLERSVLSRADRRAAEALWPRLARRTAGRCWTVRELLDAADVDPDLAVLRGASGRSLGRLLARCEGIPLAGAVVRRVGDDRDGVLWQCGFLDR